MGMTPLTSGMLVAIVAGVLPFGFSKTFGEPPVVRAVAL